MGSDSPVIGRDAELAVIEAWLAKPEDRSLGLIVEGEPGIGKTTLWRVAVGRAQALGNRVFESRPAESELKLGFSALSDLLASVGATEFVGLPPPQRRALEAALLRTEAPARRLDQRTVATAFLSLLRLLATESRLVLAIDDLQWLDAPSMQALAYAARRLDNRVRLIATLRLGSDLQTAMPEDRLTTLRVESLTLAALHRLLVARFGRSFPRLALVKIHQTSRGNPLYALEIARALIQSRATISAGAPLSIPESLGGLIVKRIAALPAPSREALRILALAGDPSSETIARSGFDDPLATLLPAIRDGLVLIEGESVRFSHPLVASAALIGVAPAQIRSIHARLAAGAGSAETRAVHLGLAASGPDEQAADSLESAAALARRRGAPIAAGEMLELARALTPDDQTAKAAERGCDAAVSYFEAGEAERAGKLLGQLVETLDGGAPKARALQVLSQIRARSNSFNEALDLAMRALDLAREDPVLRAGIELDVAFTLFCLGDLGGAARYASAAVSSADDSGQDALRARALAGASIAEFFLGLGASEARMAQAIALEDVQWQGPLEMRPGVVQALLLLWTQRLDESIFLLSQTRSEVIERGQDALLPFVSFFMAVALVWKGDLADATRHASESQEIAAISDEPVARALALASRALIDAFGGEPEHVREQAGQALALFQQSGFVVYMTWPLLAMGFLELSLGNPRRVDELLRPLAERVTAMDAGDPSLGVFLPDEIEALVALGESDRAERYLGWLERGGVRLDRPWALAVAGRCRALIAAAQDDLASALSCLEQALVQHARVAMPFERARTLLVKGQVHRRRREKKLAIDALNEALGVFQSMGASRYEVRTKAELARVGLRRKDPHELTVTEHHVAELAARGMTNREVAQAAFMSPKTVETNLARVYTKLGIRSRAQLARALDDRPVDRR